MMVVILFELYRRNLADENCGMMSSVACRAASALRVAVLWRLAGAAAATFSRRASGGVTSKITFLPHFLLRQNPLL